MNIATERPELDINLVIHSCPTVEDAKAALARMCPGVDVNIQSWQSTDTHDSAPLWFWMGDIHAFNTQARHILRAIVMPLVMRDKKFCIAFPFQMAELDAAPLSLESIARLDIEDIGALLRQVARCVNLAEINYGNTTSVVQTPIEEILQSALANIGIIARPQVKLGRYRVDFLIDQDGQKIVVEADGRGFHHPELDAVRDSYLLQEGITHILRFTGSEIFRNAADCAERVRAFLENRQPTSSVYALDPDLDDNQRYAVSHGIGPARVLAPAGSGKTKVMVNRVAELVNRGVSPRAILLLAFNRKAREQLEDRLKTMGVKVRAELLGGDDGVVCKTFNAFGLAYQTEIAGLHLKTQPRHAFWEDLMAQAVRNSGIELQHLKLTRGSRPITSFLKALAQVRANAKPSAEIVVELESYEAGINPVLLFEPVEREISRLQLSRTIQTFDDQIFLALVDLLEQPDRRKRMQQLFEYILVDEFQDLNGSQLALVDILSRPHKNLFIVGDDDQLIYGWRFADSSNILEFPARMPAEPLSATYTLGTNYRSSREIVLASKRLIDHNRRRVHKEITPSSKAHVGAMIVFAHEVFERRAEEVCTFLQRQHQQGGAEWSDMAVLCRYRAQQPLIAMALDAAGIPRTLLLRYQLFTHPECILIRSYLALVWDPLRASSEEIIALINRPNRYITTADVKTVADSRSPWQTILDIISVEGGNRALVELVRKVDSIHSLVGVEDAPATQIINEIVNAFGLDLYWRDELKTESDRSRDEQDPLQIVETVKLRLKGLSVEAALNMWDRWAKDERNQLGMEDDSLAREAKEKVVISTIHAAKGREYQAVVIFDYDAKLSQLTPEETEEERRALYVGVTRGQMEVLVTSPLTEQGVHPFIKELLAPTKSGEDELLQKDLELSLAMQGDLVLRHQEALDEIRRIESGEELARTEDSLREINSQLMDINQRVSGPSYLIFPIVMRAFHAGRIAQFKRQIEELSKRGKLLTSQPNLLLEAPKSKLEVLQRETITQQQSSRRIRNRRQQLELLRQ